MALPFIVASKENCMFGYSSITLFLLKLLVSLAFLSSQDLPP